MIFQNPGPDARDSGADAGRRTAHISGARSDRHAIETLELAMLEDACAASSCFSRGRSRHSRCGRATLRRDDDRVLDGEPEEFAVTDLHSAVLHANGPIECLHAGVLRVHDDDPREASPTTSVIPALNSGKWARKNSKCPLRDVPRRREETKA